MKRALLVSLLLAGCASAPKPIPPEDKPAPVLACADACYVPCDTRVPAWRPPDPTKSEAWDTIRPQVVTPLKLQVERCELARAACVACLEKLREQGVVQ